MRFEYSVVILSYNRLHELRRHILALLSSGVSVPEIIIVDNASSDGSREFLDELAKTNRVRIILSDKNLGVGAGRNLGFRDAQGEIVICLDDDAYVAPTQFKRVIDYFQDDALGALSFAVFHGETGTLQNPYGDAIVQVANYHGAAHAFRKTALQEIGFLDEQCTFGGEELDSCVRLFDKGYHCLFVPDIVAQHYSFLRQGPGGRQRALNWVYNYARVLFKNFPFSMATLYANRLLIARLLRSISRFDVAGALEIIRWDRKGRMDGQKQHQPVSKRTIDFYSNPDLRPEFGNVPLWRKALKRH